MRPGTCADSGGRETETQKCARTFKVKAISGPLGFPYLAAGKYVRSGAWKYAVVAAESVREKIFRNNWFIDQSIGDEKKRKCGKDVSEWSRSFQVVRVSVGSKATLESGESRAGLPLTPHFLRFLPPSCSNPSSIVAKDTPHSAP